MKQIKLFMVMLLSLVGMTAAAQQPTLVSSTATPVNKSTLTKGTKYLIAAGPSTDSYYFNVNGAKVNAPLSEAQVFTYTIANCLRRNSDNSYVYVKNSNMSASSRYNSTTMTMDISFNSEDAASIQANGRYIVSNGDNASAAGLSEDQSYNWYFYKAGVVNITYYDETNGKNIGTYTYVGRVGDQLQWPTTINGCTLSDTETYTVEEDGAKVTVNYTNDAATIKLESGRYFMKNTITIDTDNAKNDVWMTSYKSLVSLIPDARSFWSVWNVTKNDDGTYTIVNEGNSNVMTPCTNPELTELKRDNGYLYYDKKKKGYFVGSITEPETQFTNLTVTNTRDGYMIRSSEAGAGYYLSIDNKWQGANDEGGYVLESDHCIKSISSGTDGTNPYWNFVEVTDDDDRMLYENGVQGLNAYVGGLTTMNLPDADVVELQAAKEVVKKYEDDTKILKGNTTEAAVKYREFVEAINNMRSQTNTAIFCQHLVAGRPFWVETIGSRKGYLNRMKRNTDGTWTNVENSSVTEATTAGTFYATRNLLTDKITVIDPKTGAERKDSIYYTLMNGEDYYLTSPTGDLYNNSFSIVDENGKVKEWSVWSGNGYYKAGLLSGVRAVTYTKTKANALKFVIIPIVPGIYQMCDIAPKWQGDPFLTFANNNSTEKIPQLHHYRVSESFSYFKFKTYNEYKYSVKNPQNKTTYAVGTYGQLLNSTISNVVNAYYIRAGKHSYNYENDKINTIKKRDTDLTKGDEMDDRDWGIEWNSKLSTDGGNAGANSVNPGVNDAIFTVYLDEVPLLDNANVLQGMQGFVLKTTTTYEQGQPVGEKNCKVYEGAITEGSAQDLSGNNMLHAAINPIEIENKTWGNYYDIFVLAYKPEGEVIGTWHQQDVHAVGIGFYHLKRGQTLPTGRCYLSTADLCAQLKKRYPDTWDNTYFYPYPKSNGRAAAPASDEGNQNEAGFRIVFRDSNGVQTAIEEAPIIEVEDEAALDAISTLYSLDGRKVTAPKSGEVYILNGKKVMF